MKKDDERFALAILVAMILVFVVTIGAIAYGTVFTCKGS